MQGRRVQSFAELKEPGDYFGPTKVPAYPDGNPRVFFRPPVELWPGSRGLCSVAFPPHTFRECPDGSLEIRASILIHGRGEGDPAAWHGYLDEGHVWRTV